MKYVISVLGIIGVIGVIVLLSGCPSPVAINVEKGTQNAKAATLYSGISFLKDDAICGGAGQVASPVMNSELFNIIDTWTYHPKVDASKVDVFVDMSNGLNAGITGSKEHMQKLTQLLKDNAQYYKVNGYTGDTPETYKPELLDMADYNEAFDYFTDNGNYDGNHSMLQGALNACVNNEDKISIFVTDFLLDEGPTRKVKPQTTHSDLTYAITENGNAWAQMQFIKWFKNNNQLEIISVEHTLPAGYGCHLPNGCQKQIYYMIFTPAKLVGMNNDMEGYVDRVKELDNTNYLKINPLAFGFTNNHPTGVGEVDYDFSASNRGVEPIIINEKGNDYKVQFVALNIPSMKDRMQQDKEFTSFTDLTLINNLSLLDRNSNNSSPFNINVSAEFYDVTDMFYQLCSIDKSLLGASMTFDPDSYPGNLQDSGGTNAKMIGPRTKIVKDYFAYNNQDHTIIMNKTTLQADQAMFGPDKLTGKLFLCDLIVNKNDFNFAEYTNEALEWTFYNRTGQYLRNDALRASLNLALDQTASDHQTKIVYSYLIALNDNK